MMAMSVRMHPIWASGGVILAASMAGTLVSQVLVHHYLPASVRLQHTSLGGAIFSVLLLIVGPSSPFHGAVAIVPDACAGVLEEMPVTH